MSGLLTQSVHESPSTLLMVAAFAGAGVDDGHALVRRR